LPQVIFYPVGNGDTSQIILDNGKRILFDYRHQKQSETGDTPCIDLAKQLRSELAQSRRDSFDVVAFTHADHDHIAHSTEFFELWHSEQYQGKDRIKIKELWVPAAMVLEKGTHADRDKDFIILRQEARHRLREGKGIRVFSKPEELGEWLEDNNLTLEQRRHLITDAGKLVQGFTLEQDGVEFFCHSPFIKHVDHGDDLRNPASLIFQVRFQIGQTKVNYLAIGDSESEVLEDIVSITEYHQNLDRLDWDLFNIPHHCSYRALASDKGKQVTVPSAGVKKLLQRGKQGAYIISSSNPIDDTPEAYEQAQPPHIQAKKAYVHALEQVDGRKFLVTMEEPNRNKPQPLVFSLSEAGCRLVEDTSSAAIRLVSSRPPRAG